MHYLHRWDSKEADAWVDCQLPLLASHGKSRDCRLESQASLSMGLKVLVKFLTCPYTLNLFWRLVMRALFSPVQVE